MATRSKNFSKKGSRVSRVEAERFVELYNQLGTYKAVADITGRSADTVSRWVKILQAESMVLLS